MSKATWVDDLFVLMATPFYKGLMGVPTLLWGQPGIGKSMRIEEFCAALGAHLEVVIASLREPADFCGLPIAQDDGTVKMAPPIWAQRLNDAVAKGQQAFLFLDEISTAPPAVQAALLRVILDREVGDIKLSNEVRIIAAANEAEDAAGGWELAPPLANRFVHLNVSAPDFDEWSEWLVGHTSTNGNGGAKEEAAPPKISLAIPKESLRKGWERARAGVVGFLHKRRDFLMKMPSEERERGKAWPSPRSWAMASKALAGAFALGRSDKGTLLRLASGAVGIGPAGELIEYMEKLDLPDPIAVLEGREKIKADKVRVDRVFAALASVTAFVKAEENEKKRRGFAKKLFKVAIGVAAAGLGDAATLSLRPIKQDLMWLVDNDEEAKRMMDGSAFERICLAE